MTNDRLFRIIGFVSTVECLHVSHYEFGNIFWHLLHAFSNGKLLCVYSSEQWRNAPTTDESSQPTTRIEQFGIWQRKTFSKICANEGREMVSIDPHRPDVNVRNF